MVFELQGIIDVLGEFMQAGCSLGDRILKGLTRGVETILLEEFSLGESILQGRSLGDSILREPSFGDRILAPGA